MRHLSFRTLFLCVFLPPVLYVLSIEATEAVLQKKWMRELDRRIVSNPTALLEGHVSIQDEIRRNIESYRVTRYAVRLGAVLSVEVKTETGRWLYPRMSSTGIDWLGLDESSEEASPPDPLQTVKVATENMKIMEEGLVLLVTARIPRNTWLANGVLIFYVFTFSLILYRIYQTRSREFERVSLRERQDLEAAQSRLRLYKGRLLEAVQKEESQRAEMATLRGELSKASEAARATEDEALDEIEALEAKLEESAALREKMQGEVTSLAQELERLESSRKRTGKRQLKEAKAMQKRFGALYKNLRFHPNAVEGFLNLPVELNLRAEELIHNMNEDSDGLKVKRKVFSKKGKAPVLESEFGYRGRVYWRSGADGKAEVLAVGSKNSQARDLSYLDSLDR